MPLSLPHPFRESISNSPGFPSFSLSNSHSTPYLLFAGSDWSLPANFLTHCTVIVSLSTKARSSSSYLSHMMQSSPFSFKTSSKTHRHHRKASQVIQWPKQIDPIIHIWLLLTAVLHRTPQLFPPGHSIQSLICRKQYLQRPPAMMASTQGNLIRYCATVAKLISARNDMVLTRLTNSVWFGRWIWYWTRPVVFSDTSTFEQLFPWQHPLLNNMRPVMISRIFQQKGSVSNLKEMLAA